MKWYAGGVLGGSASYGTISVTGLYTAPVTSPPSSVEVKAVSEAAPAASGTATVTLLNPVPIITGITPASLTIGTGPITVAGSGFLTGATIQVGGTATAATFVSANELRATVDVKASVGGVTTVIVTNPNPGSASSAPFVAPVAPATQLMTAREAARFLEMATWGPTPDSIAHLQEVGTEQFLAEQFSATSSTYPEPVQGASGPNHAQQAFFDNAFLGQDQLRQRVAFALSQILVVSGVKTGSGYQLVPYMRLLHEGAFGNYFTLLKNVTLNPTMGRFLDMVNNTKADPQQGIEPNENYARELLQLFTVGLVMLNQNGTPQQDGSGNAMPAYTEETVKELAKALTGWTYAPQAGKTPRPFNQPNYAVPMTPWEANHDTSAKTLLLNELVPAGQTARQDLDSVIANIARHPNVAPFVALRLIQRLVMGNPSPAYVGRVATAFSLNGGDLASVTRAILLDPEAMSPAAEQGKLSEPILFITRLLRGLNATVATGNNLHRQAEILGQKLWFAPSVFNYFSPSYRIRGTNVVSPEFQITTPSAALNRANFVYKVARGSAGSAVQIDMSVFERLARDPRQLVEALSAALLEGGMSQAMKDSIITAVSATNDMRTRARNAVYLVGVSSQFQVER